MIEFRLLGSVELASDGKVVDLGRPQQRLVLAVLAAEAGRVVAVETMIDRVWDEAPPGARRALHVAITRLRRILEQVSTDAEPIRLDRRGGGYVLEVRAELVDVLRYRQLTGEGQGLEDLRHAMGLWRGEPLTGLTGAWVARSRSSLRTQHLDTVVAWARAELTAGSPAAPVGLLTELAGEFPLTESLTEILMLVLHATGRSADALTGYEKLRKRLAAELGVDPGPRLQAVYQQVLAGLPAMDAGDGHPVARQLPSTAPHFVGRAEALAVLNGLLDQRASLGGTVVITAIGGTAGVGKTALAVHWAQQVAGAFPDGQLYLNLRGFGADGAEVEPPDALRRFLNALRVSPERIPVDIEERAALYRSELAGRRMLIVLDNARDTAQVRPLLPGTPTCLVVVTSRSQLRGLVAAHGAHPIVLDRLSTAEAHDLLARRLGHDRVTAAPEAVSEIVDRCARLPLALALVAARAAVEPTATLGTLAEALRDSGRRWETLADEDPSIDVRTVFSWSYDALGTGAARLFRLLGLHPGPDIAAAAAASLAAVDMATVRTLLDELVRAGLIVEHTAGRYTSHDLLRAYATDLAHRTEPDECRRAAVHRLLDHYLHSAYAAALRLYDRRDPIDLAAPLTGVMCDDPADDKQALTWFIAEHQALLNMIEHAAATGFDTHAWQLAWTLVTYFDRQGHWDDYAVTQQAAVAAARRLRDSTAQARAHRYLGHAYTLVDRLDDAETQLRHALALHRQDDDAVAQAHTQHNLAHLCAQRGDYGQAIIEALLARDIYLAAHDRSLPDILNAIGWYYTHLGDFPQALTYCEQARTLFEETDDTNGLADSLDSLGLAHHHLGQHAEAIACYQHAIDVFRDIGDRFYEAQTLDRLGDTQHAAGSGDDARDAWQQAVTILDDLRHPDADNVRAKLAVPR